MDVRLRLRDHGQLGLALRNVLDDPTLTRLVRSTLEVRTRCKVFSQSCGDYAFFFFLIDHSRGKSMNKFLNRFDKPDYVKNDHKVGHR